MLFSGEKRERARERETDIRNLEKKIFSDLGVLCVCVCDYGTNGIALDRCELNHIWG